jgi:hypothetical protein
MPITWPISPSTGATYSYGGNEWVFTGAGWRTVGAAVPGITGATGATGADTSLIPFNEQTSDYTLQLSDKGKIVEVSTGVTGTITIPTDISVAFPTGTQVLVMRGGTGAVGITGDVGVTVYAAQGYLNLSYQYSAATLVKKAADTWYIFGDLKP